MCAGQISCHSDEKIHERYTHLDVDTKRRARARICDHLVLEKEIAPIFFTGRRSAACAKVMKAAKTSYSTAGARAWLKNRRKSGRGEGVRPPILHPVNGTGIARAELSKKMVYKSGQMISGARD